MAVEGKNKTEWNWSHALGHFRTVMKHRNLVMIYCFRAGLIRQGLTHDLSKFSWTEFSMGVKYFQGNRSPNNAEREATGITTAWLHHKGRNKHHYEYWIDYDIERKNDPPLAGMKMPKRYVIEMTFDRIAACRVYQGKAYTPRSPLEYYQRGISFHLMHEDTARLLEKLLTMLAEKGEREMYRYIRKTVLKDDFEY